MSEALLAKLAGPRLRLAITPVRVRSIATYVSSIVFGFVLWDVCSLLFFNQYLLPRPLTVMQSGWETLVSGELLESVGVSVSRILLGFGIGCVAGITCGLVMGSFRPIGEFLDPLIELVRPISPVAMIPIAIIWFGIDEASKYFIIAYGVFFTTVINTIAGVRNTPLVRKRAAQSLGAGTWDLFYRITLPSAMPFISTGMRVALGGAFMSVIAAEMIAANSGIGYFIMQARLLVQTDRIFIGLMTLGISGFLADIIYRRLVALFLGRYLRLSA
jgi:NitT/TauT family transport system permease protein/taurine transport system permease protein